MLKIRHGTFFMVEELCSLYLMNFMMQRRSQIGRDGFQLGTVGLSDFWVVAVKSLADRLGSLNSYLGKVSIRDLMNMQDPVNETVISN